MEHAKKMALVEPRLLDLLQSRQQQQQHPGIVEGTLSQLDAQMNGVLTRRDLTDEQKVKMYNDALHEYSVYSNQIQPPRVELVMGNQQQQQQQHAANSVIEEEIVDSAPKLVKNKARLLMRRLKADPNVAWNDKGELIYKGQLLAETRLNDLVQDVLRKRKSLEPRGWETFAEALRENNVPQDLVGNAERWQHIAGAAPKSVAVDSSMTTPRRPVPRQPPRRLLEPGTTAKVKGGLKRFRWAPYQRRTKAAVARR